MRGDEDPAEPRPDHSAAHDSEDALHAGVDIALTGGGLDGGLGGNYCVVKLVLDGVDKLFHDLITSFFLVFLFLICWRENENGE